jgi:hypothetical protein
MDAWVSAGRCGLLGIVRTRASDVDRADEAVAGAPLENLCKSLTANGAGLGLPLFEGCAVWSGLSG